MITSLDLVNNLQLQQLTDWNDVSQVFDLSGRYCLVSDFINKLNPAGSFSLDTTTYRKPSLGQDERVAQVASVISINAGSVIVQLLPQGTPAPSPVTFFREADHVLTSVSGVQGKVISVPSAGVLEIEPIGLGSTGGTTVAQLAAALTANSFVSSMGGIFADKWTSGVDSLNYTPEVFLNYLSVKRDGHSWAATDGVKTRPKINGKNWSDSGIEMACQRMLKDIERSNINGIQTRYNSALGGPQDCNGGIDWSIQNRGGSVLGISATPSESQFTNWLIDIHDRKATAEAKTVILGRQLYRHITNNFPEGYVKQLNVYDGQKGVDLNYPNYNVAGMEVRLMTNVPVLQDPEFDPTLTAGAGMTGRKREWYGYCIDTSPVPIVGGGTRPAIERIHFGESPYYAVFNPGIREFAVGAQSGQQLMSAAGATTSINANAIDGNSFQILYHGGIDMVGKFSGMIMPVL